MNSEKTHQPDVSIDTVLMVLNDAVERDREAISRLCLMGYPCTPALTEHKTVLTAKLPAGYFTISAVGLLNGIVRELFDGQMISAVWEAPLNGKPPMIRNFIKHAPYQKGD